MGLRRSRAWSANLRTRLNLVLNDPQVVFGDPGLVGAHRHLAERPDVFWAFSLEQLEALVLRLFAEPERLRAIPVAPPAYWELKDLLKAAFAS